MLAERNDDAIQIGRRALALAEELSLGDLHAHALNNVAVARFHAGDTDAVADLEASIAIATAANSPEAARGLNNLSSIAYELGETTRSYELLQQAVAVAERLGDHALARYARLRVARHEFEFGAWDDALRIVEVELTAAEAGAAHYLEPILRGIRADIRLSRGDVEGAVADARKGLGLSRDAGDPQALLPGLGTTAHILMNAGLQSEAAALASEFVALASRAGGGILWTYLELALVAPSLGVVDELRRFLDRWPYPSRWIEPIRAILDGDFLQAADMLAAMEVPTYEAQVRLLAARDLVTQGEPREAESQLQQALAFYRSVGANRCIREGEALFAASA